MYDVKDPEQNKEDKKYLRSNCICDRSYFSGLPCEGMFELKSVHVPIETSLK
ncbi:hypothetical protein [Clostridium fermenticellae]|uniref:hypothetical protein n=1 Tax=Clostridium fermenticellae TaxID=2068654 RepID=UPI0013C498FE|nr:hypothetical protein [Clostridium fermenticellae]